MALEAYKSWLRRHEMAVQFLEMVVSRGSWLLPDRFSSMEATAELFKGVGGAISVFHDHLLSPTPSPMGSLMLGMLSQFEVLIEMGALQLESTGEVKTKYSVLVVLELIKTAIKLQVFSKSKNGITNPGITDIQDEAGFQEQLSTALRASAVQAMHEAATALSVSQGKSPSSQGVASPAFDDNSSMNGDMWWRANRSAQKPGAQLATSPNLYTPGSDNKRGRIPASPNGLGDATSSTIKAGFHWQGADETPYEPKLRMGMLPDSLHSPHMSPHSHASYGDAGWQCHRSKHYSSSEAKAAQRLLRWGEFLSIVRPLLYVMMLHRYGAYSWHPWIGALAMELSSHILSGVGSQRLRKSLKDEEATHTGAFSGTSAATLFSLLRVQPLTQHESEIRRRRWRLAWFLLRDPFYRRILWPQLKLLCHKGGEEMSLVGMLMTRGLEVLEGIQKYYVYTSAS